MKRQNVRKATVPGFRILHTGPFMGPQEAVQEARTLLKDVEPPQETVTDRVLYPWVPVSQLRGEMKIALATALDLLVNEEQWESQPVFIDPAELEPLD